MLNVNAFTEHLFDISHIAVGVSLNATNFPVAIVTFYRFSLAYTRLFYLSK